ncbi:hypothetical protein [Thiomicrospira sp. WB1]|uniref:hypothetical protein n=1 Tax=Thiomicrospira sp. WB1 TaxID=1685380 RepID=UPI0007475D1E|nr:hypothetical protein [Thiomicrospira sp. WB1]KUJ72455.1 hypothetical protein AVO41_01185 [Thiomicrospira sp. WB1]
MTLGSGTQFFRHLLPPDTEIKRYTEQQLIPPPPDALKDAQTVNSFSNITLYAFALIDLAVIELSECFNAQNKSALKNFLSHAKLDLSEIKTRFSEAMKQYDLLNAAFTEERCQWLSNFDLQA